MRKWAATGMVLILAASFALSGCTKDTKTVEQPKSETKQEPQKKVQDTLIVGRGGDSASLDPAIVTDGESIKIAQQVFDKLLEYKAGTTEVQPMLAESWKVSNDGLVYTFSLRKGVKFHDGTDFNAEAVVFNFSRWSDPKSPYKFQGDSFDYYTSMFGAEGASIIKEVKAVDANTVQFTLNKPQAPFLQNIAMPPFSIASPKAVQEKKEKFKSEPVGTGPFVFKEWKRNDSITLEKNASYWRQGFPKLNKVIVRAIPDNSARFTALQNGELDLAEGINPDDLKNLEANKNLQKILRPSFNVGYLGFNVTKKPFDDPKVRQALNYAVNKKAIISAFFGGLAEPAVNPLPPSLWGYNKDIQDYPYDLEKAKSLLAEAGYANGLPGEYTFYAMPVSRPYMPDGKKVAEAIQADFAKIGVKTKIASPEWATYLDDVKKGEKDDLFMLGWTGDNGDPDNFLYTLLDKTNIPGNNRSRYVNEEVHSLLVEAQSATDKAKREDLYKKSQVIIKKDAPWVPIAHSNQLIGAKAGLSGYVPSPTGSEAFTEVFFK
ncbi:peptide/nickel transport system substrate-binding protein [Paenibacillus sp. yr247]|nr:peptide/nickel transport system substrate-binding protein [Paenibacillus sp. yr247]